MDSSASHNDATRCGRCFEDRATLSLLAFTIKSHAVAYARAISSSGKLALFVDNANGIAIRQSSSSLTYPIVLD